MSYAAKCVCEGCGYQATVHTRREVISFWMKHFEDCDGSIFVFKLADVKPVDVPLVEEENVLTC